MAKKIRVALLVVGGLSCVAALAVLVAWQSVKQVPTFYRNSIELDDEQRVAASDECMQQAAMLAGDLQRSGRWQTVFTADQINGWLAIDLPKNFPDALPPEIENPRVDIQADEATLACTIHQNGQSTVVSISFDAYLVKPNVVGLRLQGVRAGLLPVPLSTVLEQISEAAQNCDIMLEWRQSHGDPVIMLTLPGDDENSAPLQLETIELRDGEIYVAGSNGANDQVIQDPSQATEVDNASETGDQPAQARAESDTNENHQR